MCHKDEETTRKVLLEAKANFDKERLENNNDESLFYYVCDNCKKDIKPGSQRYHCLQCPDYDLCGDCLRLQNQQAFHTTSHAFEEFGVAEDEFNDASDEEDVGREEEGEQDQQKANESNRHSDDLPKPPKASEQRASSTTTSTDTTFTFGRKGRDQDKAKQGGGIDKRLLIGAAVVVGVALGALGWLYYQKTNAGAESKLPAFSLPALSSSSTLS